jgi:hypothetical protein
MGTTNLRASLEKRYASLAGSLVEVRANIARIEREAGTLPDLNAETERLTALVDSAALLLEDVDPTFRRDHVRPVKPWTHGLPVPFGTCGRRGMAVLREAGEAMTTRQIATEVLRRTGVEAPDQKVMQRTVNAIEACLRKHRGRGVESSGKYPAQWRASHKQELAFE